MAQITLGIIGGGQLGSMLANAAKKKMDEPESTQNAKNSEYAQGAKCTRIFVVCIN